MQSILDFFLILSVAKIRIIIIDIFIINLIIIFLNLRHHIGIHLIILECVLLLT